MRLPYLLGPFLNLQGKQGQALLAVFTGTRWIRVAHVDMRDWTRSRVDTLEAPGWSIAIDLANKIS